MLRSLINVLLPTSCLLCSQSIYSTDLLCGTCFKRLPILPKHCPQCARFLFETSLSQQKCGDCLLDPPSFDLTYTLFPYFRPLPTLITELKFKQQLSHAQFFADCFIKKIQWQWYYHQPLPDLILPIPLHRSRLIERGFNQAVEIAKPIAKKLNLTLDLTSIIRVKPTLAQSGLNAKARKINILNAFESNRRYDGLSIALVDDVMTTGLTVSTCAKILKAAGAKRVEIWAVARN